MKSCSDPAFISLKYNMFLKFVSWYLQLVIFVSKDQGKDYNNIVVVEFSTNLWIISNDLVSRVVNVLLITCRHEVLLYELLYDWWRTMYDTLSGLLKFTVIHAIKSRECTAKNDK